MTIPDRKERAPRKTRGRSTKSRQENTVDASIGIDESTANAAQERANQIINAQRGMELSISPSEKASFTFVSVAPTEIKDTYVYHSNQRDQEMLTDVTCSDITSTLSRNGNDEPAKGYYDSEGKICVVAGSRRRFSCMSEQVPFNILVTKQLLTEEQADHLTKISDQYKKPGIIERAKLWVKSLKSGKFDQKSLAAFYNESEANISIGKRAIEYIPRDILLHLPAATELGAPSLKKLTAAFEPLKGDKLSSAIEQCLSIDIHKVHDGLESDNHEKWNGAVINKMIIECRKASNSKARAAKQKPITWKDPSLKGAECVVSESTKGTSITLKKFPDNKKSMILKATKTLSEAKDINESVLQNLYSDLKQLIEEQ